MCANRLSVPEMKMNAAGCNVKELRISVKLRGGTMIETGRSPRISSLRYARSAVLCAAQSVLRLWIGERWGTGNRRAGGERIFRLAHIPSTF